MPAKTTDALLKSLQCCYETVLKPILQQVCISLSELWSVDKTAGCFTISVRSDEVERAAATVSHTRPTLQNNLHQRAFEHKSAF